MCSCRVCLMASYSTLSRTASLQAVPCPETPFNRQGLSSWRVQVQRQAFHVPGCGVDTTTCPAPRVSCRSVESVKAEWASPCKFIKVNLDHLNTPHGRIEVIPGEPGLRAGAPGPSLGPIRRTHLTMGRSEPTVRYPVTRDASRTNSQWTPPGPHC